MRPETTEKTPEDQGWLVSRDEIGAMGEFLNRTREQILQFWGGLSGQNRAITAGIAVMLVAMLGAFASFGRSPEMAPLYSNLDSEDASQIINRLDEMGVPYKLDRGGQAIRVASQKVDETRLRLAGEGLPSKKGVIGMEALDKPALGMSEKMQDIQYKRALEGQISRTLEQIEGVRRASVMITQPKPSLYTDKEEDAKAAVMLTLKPGQEISRQDVRSAVYFISHSVEGLKGENIRITDSQWETLYDGSEAGESGGLTASAMTQLEARRTYEKEMSGKIQRTLDRVLGEGNAQVQVSADLDFDRQETEKKTYQPVAGTDHGVVESQQTTEENFKGQGGIEGGIPGTASNVAGSMATPSYPQATGGNSTQKRSDEIVNYNTSYTVEKKVTAPGNLEKLSVAVLVDSGQKEINRDLIATVNKFVTLATGTEATNVTVAAIPFNRDAEKQRNLDLAKQERWQQIQDMLAKAVPTVLVLVFAFALWRMTRRRPLEDLAAEQMALPAEPVSLEALMQQATAQLEDKNKDHTEIALKEDSDLREIADLASQKPEMVALLLKGWLAEEKR
ncbi:MAG: flagellar M-ring protein FliF [Armatimonadetes bacterium]|nr:flagellar M-ring protein FliF [Armatimonadota bacterium]